MLFASLIARFASFVLPSWLFPIAIAASVAAAGVGGFSFGYHVGNRNAEVAALNTQVAALHATLDLRDASDKSAKEFAEWTTITETANAVTNGSLDAAIQNAPRVVSCLTADFLSGLRNLK